MEAGRCVPGFTKNQWMHGFKMPTSSRTMGKLIKLLSNGATVEFDKGKFDEWCVYVSPPNGLRFAPTDVQYFSRLQTLGAIHGANNIYQDFLAIYHLTHAALDVAVIEKIGLLSKKYGPDAVEMEQWLAVIYAGMVAEENKAHAILKKRIKRLGMHQVLVEGEAPHVAAHFSRGKKWRELDALMREKGF